MTEAADDGPASGIGLRVRAHRQARGWSMRELARRTGVSQPFVSKLESGLLLPSLPTLYDLAAALDLPVSLLLPAVPPTVSPGAATGVHLPLADEPGSAPVRLISGGEGRILQMFEFRLAANDGDTSDFCHTGEEVAFVIEGTLVSHRRGNSETILTRGESLRIDPTVPHHWRAGDSGAVFLLTCADGPQQAPLGVPEG